MNKEIGNMKMSDLVGKHKRKECFEKVYGEPPMSIGMKFFALDHEYGCGKPSIYMGEKK